MRPAIHLREPHLQHHLLALAAAGQLQHVDDLQLRRASPSAISPARSITALLDTLPDRISASSVTLTRMSSPGNSVLQLLLKRRHAGIDHDVVLLARGRRPR